MMTGGQKNNNVNRTNGNGNTNSNGLFNRRSKIKFVPNILQSKPSNQSNQSSSTQSKKQQQQQQQQNRRKTKNSKYIILIGICILLYLFISFKSFYAVTSSQSNTDSNTNPCKVAEESMKLLNFLTTVERNIVGGSRDYIDNTILILNYYSSNIGMH